MNTANIADLILLGRLPSGGGMIDYITLIKQTGMRISLPVCAAESSDRRSLLESLTLTDQSGEPHH